MAGYLYFKDAGIVGEATQGACVESFRSPNNLDKEDFYVGWIELISVTQAVNRSIEAGRSGTARSRAGVVFEEVTIEKEVDRASTELLHACSGGTSFPEVFIHVCASITDREGIPDLHPYFEFHLWGVKVTRYEITCSGLNDGQVPTETLNLNFDKVIWRYWPIGPMPDGNLEMQDVAPNKVHEHVATGMGRFARRPV